jgi:hypothetical protein
MKILLTVLLLLMLFMTGCASHCDEASYIDINNIPDNIDEVHIDTDEGIVYDPPKLFIENDEPIEYLSPVVEVAFFSEEEFVEAVRAARANKGSDNAPEDIALLGELPFYFRPTHIPADYHLFKIVAAGNGILFCYATEDAIKISSLNADLIDGYQFIMHHFLYDGGSAEDPLGAVMRQHDFPEESLETAANNDDIKYMYNEGTRLVYWVQDGILLSMTVFRFHDQAYIDHDILSSCVGAERVEIRDQ